MKTHYYKDLKGYVASSETSQDRVIYTLKEHNIIECLLSELKDKLYHKNKQLKNLKADNKDLEAQVQNLLSTGAKFK